MTLLGIIIMKTYYVYHVPGIKIGCTSDLNKRMKDQGFTNWEILENHTDIYIASEREIELQKQYGYKIDSCLYWQSIKNRPKWNKETRKTFTKETASIAGSNGKGSKKYSNENYIKAALNRPTKICEVCGNPVKVNVYKQHINSHKKG